MKELSLHILDLAQNAIRARASIIQVLISENQEENLLTITITDNGEGMLTSTLEKAADPFFTSRTTRNVGLGIPLFKQMTVRCEGEFSLTSAPGKGTIIQGSMKLLHLDRQPLGDIAGVMVILMTANPGIRFIYRHTTPLGNYNFDTEEIRTTLETDRIDSPGLLNFIREMIRENLTAINIQC